MQRNLVVFNLFLGIWRQYIKDQSTFAIGSWFKDDLTIGGKTVKGYELGLALSTETSFRLLGLSWDSYGAAGQLGLHVTVIINMHRLTLELQNLLLILFL